MEVNNKMRKLFTMLLVFIIVLAISTPTCFAASWIRCGYTNDGMEFGYDAHSIRHIYSKHNVALTTGKWRVMDMNSKTGNVYEVVIRDSDLGYINSYMYEFVNGKLVDDGPLNQSIQHPPRNSNFEKLFYEMVSNR